MREMQRSVALDECAGAVKCQALVEGRISPGEGNPPVERVYLTGGWVVASKLRAGQDVLTVEGRITVDVVYGSEGEVCAFQASAPFSHDCPLPGLTADSAVQAMLCLEELEVTEEGRALLVEAVVNIDAWAAKPGTLTLPEVGEGCETRVLDCDIARTLGETSGSALVREEALLPQGLPACERVLYTRATPVPREAVCEDGKLLVTGDVEVITAYVCADPALPVRETGFTFPFDCLLPLSAAKAGQEAMAQVGVEEVYTACLGDLEGGARALSYEIALQVRGCAIQRQLEEVLLDVYATDRQLLPSYQSAQMLLGCPAAHGRVTHRGSVGVADDLRGSRALVAMAQPVVTATTPQAGGVEVEGMLFCRCLCVHREGHLAVADGHLPFRILLDAPALTGGMLPHVELLPQTVEAVLSGEELEVRAVLQYTVCGHRVQPVTAVEAVASGEEVPAPIDGILVYFAGGGEDLWSLAKNYNTTLACIRKFNPKLQADSLQAGDKVMLLSGRA